MNYMKNASRFAMSNVSPLWKDDKELFAITKREVFTALVGDILDKLGYLHQFLPANIKPLRSDMVIVGRAMPVLEADISNDKPGKDQVLAMSKLFGIMLEALDDLKVDEVYICAGASASYALWGGLMTTRAMQLGAAGAVLDGYSRDTNEILKLNFPIFGMGAYAQDQEPRGKVIDFRVPIEFKGIKVNPGDIIFGDLDGVVVIPAELEKEVFSGAIEKARGEKIVQKASFLYWLPKFLHSNHRINLSDIGLPLIIIYIISDGGAILGGWLSSFMVRKGVDPVKARKRSILFLAFLVVPIFFAAFIPDLWIAVALISIAAFAHQGYASNIFTIISDIYPKNAVGSMVGLSLFAGSVGGVLYSSAVGFVLESTGNYYLIFGFASIAYLLSWLFLKLFVPDNKVIENIII